ncbi:KpsF/GutQ family sugar-phosphate isomerase [Rhizobium sp. 9T]|uniref:KpsF/GutQ family sugar-phosphate isomerase n=1 Tax=Rhizobium croatiense TaxID=2867516 RepID=A0ABS7LXZ1_9HYPH|nr:MULTISPECIES: KpsF/GutQ family sugar-phosphate isomerase [Rhizobium]MBY4610295.1 KpsF/GutQ family sugar-phosphate isomerase [Rhizobium croatiense]MBY4629722.1 KpsF/GutQ family sugar-phosphate isomerase [Rhizobium croatiense]PDV88202.1 KpsF/GutQ family sugar-phosphate isomerase [Rhizobium sp. H4]WET73000.1 KpsF/GutQ family sugar-phosphate isomerase [Rhizobium croatiense]
MNRRAIKLVENGVLESAKRTIEIEKRGLEALEQALDNGLAGPFTRAIEVIGDISGRVIVTGVGKSGHIGAKLAATFASTGTPAFFVHAAEANHGDLGMIARDDVVLAISKGGESAELKSIISFTRRFSIPLIALTCGEHSSLATAADIVLLVPNEQEACPNGLAPTTSTLMQLALGDALAVALLEARGFTATDFHVFHPGGKLGASLTHVADIMHTGERLPLVAKGTPMPEAITVLSRKHFGCVGVLDEEGRLCGIVTEGDMARNLTRNLAELAVDDIMTKTPKTVKPTILATAALALLNQHSIGALIVVDDDRRPLGLVHFHDLLRIGVA